MKIATRRPIWVWLISIFYVGGGVINLIVGLLILRGVIPGSHDAIVKLTTSENLILGTLSFIGSVGGAIALWLLRKPAWMLLSAAFVINAGQSICSQEFQELLCSGSHWPVSMRGDVQLGAIIGMTVGILLQLLVCWYAWKLARSGLMR